MSDLAAWVLSVGSFAAIVLLTAFGAKAFAGEPARGRRRCPRCWHELGPAPEISGIELSGTELSDSEAARRSRQCSECGFVASREKDTLRTHRRIGLGLLAIAAILAIVGAARLRFLSQGPWSMAPTRVLLFLSPYIGEGGYRSPQGELANRIRIGAADDAQLRDAVEMVVAGVGDGSSDTASWAAQYGEIAQALLLAIPRGDPLLTRFLEIPPELELEFHSARAGRARLLGVEAYPYWPAGIESRLTIEFADGTARRARFTPSSRGNHLLVEVPASLGPGDEVRFVLAVRPLGGSVDAPWIEYPSVSRQIPTIVGRDPKEPDAAPIDTPEIREALTRVFSPDYALSVWASGTPRAGLQFNTAPASRGEFDGVLFGLRVEVCEEGVVRRTSRIWWHGGDQPDAVRWLPSIEDPEALTRLFEQDPKLDAKWTLRITGDPDLADYARPPVARWPKRDAFRSWSGTIEVPLVVDRKLGASPDRRWTLEQ